MSKKALFLILVCFFICTFYSIAQGPPPPPSQGGNTPTGVPIDGSAALFLVASFGILVKKYFTNIESQNV